MLLSNSYLSQQADVFSQKAVNFSISQSLLGYQHQILEVIGQLMEKQGTEQPEISL